MKNATDNNILKSPSRKERTKKKRVRKSHGNARVISAWSPDMLHDAALSELNENPVLFSRSISDSLLIPADTARRGSLRGLVPGEGFTRSVTGGSGPTRQGFLREFGRTMSTSNLKPEPLISLEDLEYDSEEDDHACEDESELESDGEESESSAIIVSVLFAGIVLSQLLANASLQKLNSVRPGCGQLVTLFQYLATILEKVPYAVGFLREPILPLQYHVVFVALMFLTAKFSNMSVESPMMSFSLFLVIKNSNLVFSLLLGRLALKRKYSTLQVLSVVAVSVGMSVCVLLQEGGTGNIVGGAADGPERTLQIVLRGPLLCAASTLTIAALGIVQEHAFRKHHDVKDPSRGPSECLFFMHFLGLPLFAMGGGVASMKEHAVGLVEAVGGVGMASTLTLLNVVSMVMLKRCFVELLDRASSLTATMAITVSRTVGVVLSAVPPARSVGDPPLGVPFWAGAATVACGSIGYVVGGAAAAKRKTKEE